MEESETMEETKRLRFKFIALMEDFCVPFDTTFIEDFEELDFQDEPAIDDFLGRLSLKEKILEDKVILLWDASDLAQKLKWLAKLDDPFELKVPFDYLHVGRDQPFEEIKAHYILITTRMREEVGKGMGVEQDLALCEKAFKRIREIRGCD
jgi:hypothetical protein